MSEYPKFLKKYWPYTVAILFAIAIMLGFLQRGQTRYTINNATTKQLNNEELWTYYNQARDFAGNDSTKNKQTVSFLAVGDIMLSRNVAGTIKKTNDPLLPFSQMTDVFKSVDFSFGNLESPFSGKDTFNPTGSMIFNAPRDNIKGLVENKFKILNLANNHALDQGDEGLKYTLQFLNENNILHVGAGLTMEDAWNHTIVEQNGIKICFIGASYASVNDNGKTTNDYVARIDDLDLLKTNIQNLKPNCDFVVASMHAGTEYTRKPNQLQTDFAHTAIDAGADMVIGHHPHWIQTIERYCPSVPYSPGEEKMPEGRMRPNCPNPKYIFYSLGNFIFDQMWSQETREGLNLKIQISKTVPPTGAQNELQGPRVPATLESIKLMPIIIENYSTPRLANEAETKKILGKIGEINSILK